jgi:hypothetical protein
MACSFLELSTYSGLVVGGIVTEKRLVYECLPTTSGAQFDQIRDRVAKKAPG